MKGNGSEKKPSSLPASALIVLTQLTSTGHFVWTLHASHCWGSNLLGCWFIFTGIESLDISPVCKVWVLKLIDRQACALPGVDSAYAGQKKTPVMYKCSLELKWICVCVFILCALSIKPRASCKLSIHSKYSHLYSYISVYETLIF